MHSNMRQVSQMPPEVLPGNWTEATPCHVRPGAPLLRERLQRRGCTPDKVTPTLPADGPEH